ncbi:hypothetical protein PC116_g17377 [Phytophthora cactorum]|nr:hypothetical protein PC112_g13377 [Phytophthora cactorum]KAG3077458.1 hypothetical protein PC122_g13148 [Phytophthora cactorum]KAG4234458.1 hypothetical protein PC116_g17377 [Phytophthora cactorum]
MAVSRSYLWEQNPNIILPKKNLKPKLLLIAAQAILTFFYIGFGVVFTSEAQAWVLYQLAFALETEMEQLQGRLFVWIVVLLQLPLVHFGMDFSFQFEWMHSQSTDA